MLFNDLFVNLIISSFSLLAFSLLLFINLYFILNKMDNLVLHFYKIANWRENEKELENAFYTKKIKILFNLINKSHI